MSLKSLGPRIKKLREDAGLSQAKLANLAGLTQGQISNYESCKGDITLESAAHLAKALGVSVAALIGDEAPEAAPPRKPTPEEMAEAVLTALGVDEMRMRLIRAVLRVPEELVPQLGVPLKTLEGLVPSPPASNETKRSTG
jgi:transcriptional regulator with XRE-family HTH domain